MRHKLQHFPVWVDNRHVLKHLFTWSLQPNLGQHILLWWILYHKNSTSDLHVHSWETRYVIIWKCGFDSEKCEIVYQWRRTFPISFRHQIDQNSIHIGQEKCWSRYWFSRKQYGRLSYTKCHTSGNKCILTVILQYVQIVSSYSMNIHSM